MSTTTDFPHISPAVLRFLEWVLPRVAERRSRAAALPGPDGRTGREAVPEGVTPPPGPREDGDQPVATGDAEASPAAAERSGAPPAAVDRLLAAAGGRGRRRETALAGVPLASALFEPAGVPAPYGGRLIPGAPGPAVVWATGIPPGSPGSPGSPGLPVEPGLPGGPGLPVGPGWVVAGPMAPEPMTPGVLDPPGPAGEAGHDTLPLVPEVGPQAPPRTRPGRPGVLAPPGPADPAPAPGPPAGPAWTSPDSPAFRGPPHTFGEPHSQVALPPRVEAAPAPQGRPPGAGGAGAIGEGAAPGARLLEEARLRQMLAEIIRADALRHGLTLKER